MVSTSLKKISQITNLPQIGMKLKNIWNHHLDIYGKKQVTWGNDSQSNFGKMHPTHTLHPGSCWLDRAGRPSVDGAYGLKYRYKNNIYVYIYNTTFKPTNLGTWIFQGQLLEQIIPSFRFSGWWTSIDWWKRWIIFANCTIFQGKSTNPPTPPP